MTVEKFKDLYEKEIVKSGIYPGALIIGEVIAIDNKFVVVSAFLKTDSHIPISQFKNENGKLDVEIGSKVEVVIESLEDLSGNIRLSREKAKRLRVWEDLERIYKTSEIISGFVTAKVKGGFTVKLENVKAFLPGSLVYFKSPVDSDEIKGKEFKFKIIKLEKKKNNIVVTQKIMLEEKNGKTLQNLLSTLNEGNIVPGVVKNITDYGVFVDLGGLDGLVHITDMSWKRVKHPSTLFKIGDSVKVKVLRFDKVTNKVSLGLKQLTKDPWKIVKEKYKEGLFVNGRVTNITDYGCFVELEEGIEGLVHSSEMDWINRNVNPNKIVKHGMDIKVSILDVNAEKRRISLGLKQVTINPWVYFSKKFKNGDKVSGKVKSVTEFGIFLELNGGIDGLVHLSDISWENSSDSVLRDFKKGDVIQTMLLGIDVERERISLGIKQLTFDLFLNYIFKHVKGSIVECTLIKKIEKGYIVSLADGVEGFLKSSDSCLFQNKDLNKDLNNDLKKQCTIKARIVNIDSKNKSIILVSKIKSDFKKKELSNKNEFKIGKT